MSQAEIIESLPAAARKHVDPSSPMPPRMMAAKGLVPLPPRDMVLVLCALCLDSDATLKEAASASLKKLPDKILAPALGGELPETAWGVLAEQVSNEELLEKVVVNRSTPDAALAALAPRAPAKIVEILAENQERCMRSEALVRGLRQSTVLLKSSLGRLFDFLVRAGVVFDDMPEFAESLQRLSPAELTAAAEKVELPSELNELLREDPAEPTVAEAADVQVSGEVSVEDDEEAEGEEGGEAPETARKRIPMTKLIAGLNAAQKVALAMKGNKEARSLLLRDSNRVVAVAAIRNPRLTVQEVQAAAKSRTINDEVVRIICSSRDMTRSYGVKLALVNNPKTPLTIAMRMLAMLTANDLRNLAKSKSVPNAVAVQARKLMMAKQQ